MEVKKMEESKIMKMKEALRLAHAIYVEEFVLRGKKFSFDKLYILDPIDKEMICKLGMSLFISDIRMNGVKANETQEPATEKQKAYMKKLKMDVPEGLTKREAMAVIDKKLAK